MTPDQISDLLGKTIMTTFAMAGPVLLVGLAVGFAISLFQAATQINEVTLVFIPKMVAAGLVLWLTGGWIFERLMLLVNEIHAVLPTVGQGV